MNEAVLAFFIVLGIVTFIVKDYEYKKAVKNLEKTRI
jgi:hypothetical protein